LAETPKETGNKLLYKINCTICQIKMQRIFYVRKSRNQDAAKILVFYSSGNTALHTPVKVTTLGRDSKTIHG